jgi:hypothetical protein
VNVAGLLAVLAEWSKPLDSYAARIKAIRDLITNRRRATWSRHAVGRPAWAHCLATSTPDGEAE